MLIIVSASPAKEVTMMKQVTTQTTLDRTALPVPGVVPGGPLEGLRALVHEWWARRGLERSLGRLSNSLLRDAGLIGADVEAACAGRLGRSAVRALRGVAQNRIGNW
jgi:uncharacterized protein YjiS (DUF1127 family)